MDELSPHNEKRRKWGEPDAGWDVCILGATTTVPWYSCEWQNILLASGAGSAHLSPHVVALLSCKCSAVIALWQQQSTPAAAVGPPQAQQQLFNHLNFLPSRWNALPAAGPTLCHLHLYSYSPHRPQTDSKAWANTKQDKSGNIQEKRLPNRRKEPDADVYRARSLHPLMVLLYTGVP